MKDWHQKVQSREWLIVHVAEKSSSLKLQFRSIHDKIKGDFHSKKDRYVQLKGQEGWDDFVTKLKEGISSAFETTLNLYEEEIRKEDAQRLLPHWNFGNFFLLKEGLALTYEQIGLVSEALIQYAELEALFVEGVT